MCLFLVGCELVFILVVFFILLSMLDGLAICKGYTVPMVLSFVPNVLLFILTVRLLILIEGPVFLMVFFLILPAGERGGGQGGADLGFAIGTVFRGRARGGVTGPAALGLAIGTVFSWLGGGIFLFSQLGRGEGQAGGRERDGVTVCLVLYYELGPVILTLFFSYSPGWEGGAKGEWIWDLLLGRCFFLFSWSGRCFFLFSHFRDRGKEGGHGEWGKNY